MTDDTDTDTDHEGPDPEDDPFACSICGCYLNESRRIAGKELCRLCSRESAAVSFFGP